MKPRYIFHLNNDVFGATTACDGGQIAAVVAAIGDLRPDLIWYIADAQVKGPRLTKDRRPTPESIGDTAATIAAANAVAQFDSGVLVGVSDGCTNPTFREGGLWTEDEDDADLWDALVEIRAFDYSYVSVATNDEAIASRVSVTFLRPDSESLS